MPSRAKNIRTAHALLRELGVPEEDRHWLQEEVVGKASMKDFAPRDFDAFIAHLQRLTGQHQDGHAHVREDRPPEEPPPEGHAGDLASAKQAGYIERLCDEVEWRKGRQAGPVAYLCKAILRGPEADLRRETIKAAAARGVEGYDLWRLLWGEEASLFIRALRKQALASPAEASHGR